MSAYFPTYQTADLQNFATTVNSEIKKRNITSIVNRVYSDVLRAAKNGDYSSTTDITGTSYTIDEIADAITALSSIFPTPTIITQPSSTSSTKTIGVSWSI